MKDITEMNMDKKLTEIDKLMDLWLPRNLTPYGKITLLKSLVLSEITHILLSLSSQKPSNIIFFLNVQKFSWGDKPPEFKQCLSESDKELGDLELTNILLYDKALKISWLRRICNQTEGWASFPLYYNIAKAILW